MSDRTLQEYIDLAPHYIAIGQTDIHIFRAYGSANKEFWSKEYPWEYVTDVKVGSMGRYNTYTSLTFEALHSCGLTFYWSLDIEPDGFQQGGYLTPDIARLKTALTFIPVYLEQKFKAALLDFLKRVEEQTEESRQYYVKQRDKAKALRAFVEDVVEEE